MSFAWLGIFSLILQKKPNLYRVRERALVMSVSDKHFHIRWIYSRQCDKSVAHVNMRPSVISDQGSSLWTRWLDTRITASAIHYARGRARSTFETLPSTGKPRCLSTMINVKSLKNRGNASEKLPMRERLPKKNTIAVDEDIAGFRSVFPPHLSPIIPDALSRKNYETFLSWGNCFYSNLIPLFRLLSSHPECVCVRVCVRAIGVLTQLNIVPLFLDLTQGDSASCHTFLLF